MVSKTEQGHLPKEVSKRAADKHAELLSVLLQLPHPNVDPAFWCGQVGVTREYVFNYPSVYDLHWSHYYSEVIHIQNHLFFYKEISSAGLLKKIRQKPSKHENHFPVGKLQFPVGGDICLGLQFFAVFILT